MTADLRTRLSAALEGRYVLEQEIGEGGMATVFLGRDLRHERRVAIKLLKPDLGAVLGGERFLAEIKVTANLQHPNLLPLFDSGQADGLLYYVMPFIEGESLRARLDREKQLPVEEALRMAKALASALDYAHRNGVIHRDLKPENILLQDGQPHIADFGIALAVSNAGGQRVTQTGLSLGTPQYMSPEQATGDRGIDARSDLYSLGAIVYEMLAGEPPHAGSTAQAVIAKLMTEEPRPLRQLRKTVPQPVEHAVRCAMEKLPADRFATAREFADALEGRHTSMPVYTDGAPPIAGGKRYLRSLLPAAVLLGVAIGGGSVWMLARPDGAGQSPTVRVPLLPGAPGEQVTEQIAVAPDGQSVVYGSRDTLGVIRLYLRSMDAVEARLLPATEGAISPAFSPDGQTLAFVADGEIRKLRLSDGSTTRVAKVRAGTVVWASDAELVLNREGRLYRLPANGGPEREVQTPDSLRQRSLSYPLPLRDGRTVVVGDIRGGPSTGRLLAIDLETGAPTDLALQGARALAVMDGSLLYLSGAGQIMAVPFDEGTLTAKGTPLAVVSGLRQVGRILEVQNTAFVSPAGTVVYQAGRSTNDLVLTDGRVDTPILEGQTSLMYPRYSPDGKRIAVSVQVGESGGDIWIYNLSNRTFERFTKDGWNERAEWTPDGSRLLYRSDRGGQYRIWSQAVAGGAPRLELERPGKDLWQAILSPDGRYLAYRSGARSGADVWLSEVGRTGSDRPVATDPGADIAPRISPDGRWIAYASEASGRMEVMIARFPSLAGRLQVSDGGSAPVWADSRTLVYSTGDAMVRVVISDGAEPTVLERGVLMRRFVDPIPAHAMFDVAPDGKRLLLVVPRTDDVQTVIAFNWRAELQRVMAEAR